MKSDFGIILFSAGSFNTHRPFHTDEHQHTGDAAVDFVLVFLHFQIYQLQHRNQFLEAVIAQIESENRSLNSSQWYWNFIDVRIIAPLVDTIGMPGEERTALFQTTFTWRKQYFEHQVDIAPDERERKRAVKALKEFSAKVDMIEELFSDPEYYFGYYITIAIATNEKDV